MKDVREQLQTAMKAKNLTYRGLSAVSDVNLATVHEIVSGVRPRANPSYHNVEKVAKALGFKLIMSREATT